MQGSSTGLKTAASTIRYGDGLLPTHLNIQVYSKRGDLIVSFSESFLAFRSQSR